MCNVRILFADITDIGNIRAQDMKNPNNAKKRKVPSVFLFVAGFSCKSVSANNNNRELFASACYAEYGETGVTFAGVLGYVGTHLPFLFLLENVRGLRTQLPQVEPV